VTTSPDPGVPTLADDPFAPEILAEPHAFHERLREAGPVVRLDRYGVYGLGRYEQVHAALTDWETFISSAGVGLSDFRKEKPWRTPSLLLEADPPAHTRARSAVQGILSTRALRQLRPAWEQRARELVGQLVEQGSFDAVSQLAEAYPLSVFPDAVGLPPQGRENLLPYGNIAFNAFGPRNELLAESMTGAEPVQEWVMAQTRREALSPGGFGAQIWAAADSGQITEQEAPLLVRSLLTAGLDTTVNGLAAFVCCVASHPDQWALLRENPGLVRVAFDEAVRYESPVQTFFRTATCDADMGGTTIPADAKIFMFLGAANRDPRQWQNPDRFDVTRKVSGHVGFGMGIHQCVGQHVARLEGELVLTALVQQVQAIEITGKPQRRLNNTLRAWASLPVTVHPA
jgi:cytochrome P450